MQRLIWAVLAWLLVALRSINGQESTTDAVDPAAEVSAAIETYVNAFNDRSVTQLVEMWSPEGIYLDRTTGEQVVGRAAIKTGLEKLFQGENAPTLALKTESLEFVSPNVALERGTAVTSVPSESETQTSYSVVYVKRDNQWLIDRVTEEQVASANPQFEQLKGLEWLIGEWVDQVDDVTVEMSCRWTENQTFISRTYKVLVDNEVQSSGLQIIGWDASSKEIRSWLFDSDGSFVSGTWSTREDEWIVQSIATLADGGRGSFISKFRPRDDGSYSWEKINQVVDGQLLPNVDETIVRRK